MGERVATANISLLCCGTKRVTEDRIRSIEFRTKGLPSVYRPTSESRTWFDFWFSTYRISNPKGDPKRHEHESPGGHQGASGGDGRKSLARAFQRRTTDPYPVEEEVQWRQRGAEPRYRVAGARRQGEHHHR